MFINKNGYFEFQIDGNTIEATLETMEPGILDVMINLQQNKFYISGDSHGNANISFNGCIFTVRREDILVAENVFGGHGEGKEDGQIVSPMPGKIIKINVKEGDKVKKGNVLLIVEAMKMENNIISPKDAVVEKVNVKAGEMVDGSTELVILNDE